MSLSVSKWKMKGPLLHVFLRLDGGKFALKPLNLTRPFARCRPFIFNLILMPLDLRVFGFTLALSFATGLLFGSAPAWRATRIDLTPSLKENARSSSGVSRSLLSKSLVISALFLWLGRSWQKNWLRRSRVQLSPIDSL